MNIKKQDVLRAGLFVLGCEAVGGLGAVFTMPKIGTWYAALNKPEIAPPNWIFGPVWTILFALMGVAAYLVWSRYGKAVEIQKEKITVALAVFGGQLILNSFWSMIFFGANLIGNALAEIFILWMAILLTIIKFKSVSKVAAYLLLPYLLWVSFAGYLNFLLLQLN